MAHPNKELGLNEEQITVWFDVCFAAGGGPGPVSQNNKRRSACKWCAFILRKRLIVVIANYRTYVASLSLDLTIGASSLSFEPHCPLRSSLPAILAVGKCAYCVSRA